MAGRKLHDDDILIEYMVALGGFSHNMLSPGGERHVFCSEGIFDIVARVREHEQGCVPWMVDSLTRFSGRRNFFQCHWITP